MKRPAISDVVMDLLFTALIWLLSSHGLLWVALPVVVLATAYPLLSEGELTRDKLVAQSPRWLVGLSVALSIALLPKLVSQLALAAGYWLWLIYVRAALHDDQPHSLPVSGIVQFMALSSIFLASALWHFSSAIVVAAVWISSFVAADGLLRGRGERARPVLAAAWALIATQCAWILWTWTINYLLFGGYLIIPQAAVVITAMGYCFGGIYLAHLSSRLSRARLIEYLMIGLLLIGIVLYGTKWSGVI
ncbi:MAG TPA: hypothetical protein VLF41_02200 [Candidatus Nanoarchaeia archaeon]|nr:hypothetical protein [Candidatus Nanoarchaeia archaeon]